MPDTPTPDPLTKRDAHAEAVVRKAGLRYWALDDGSRRAFGSLLAERQKDRAAEGKNYDPDEAAEYVRDEVAPLVPGLLQDRPTAEAPPVSQVWRDPATDEPARNPWSDPQDVQSQAAVQKHDPALAAHLQRIAEGGTTYALIAELREAEERRKRLAAIRYGEAEHRANPFRDSTKLDAQSRMMAADPELGEVYKREAQPLTLPWQVGHRNMTEMGRISAGNPKLGELIRKAEALLEQSNRDALVRARQAEETARRERVALEQKLVAPPPKP